MTFGFYCNWSIFFYEDWFYIDPTDCLYVESARLFSDNVLLLTTVKCARPPGNYKKLEVGEVEIISLPFFSSYLGAVRYFATISRGIVRLVRRSDFVYIRTPEPFSWVAALVPKKKSILNYHYASNPMEVIFNDSRSSMARKFFRSLAFAPECFFISISAFFNKSSANGKSVLRNVPSYLKKKLNIVYESTLSDCVVQEKHRREILLSPEVRFLSVGRLQPGKGLFELLEAFSIFKKKYPLREFSLTVVGDGPLASELSKYSDFLGLNESVEFLGAVANGVNLNCIYSSHDVFVMPSLSETGPRVVLEAMSESNLCICTDVGYVSEVLDNSSALIVPPGDVGCLVDSLSWVFENKNTARVKAGLGFEKSKYYTVENFFKKIFEG